MTNLQRKPLELYIHVPFCARKCLYCDFLSFRALASVHEAYTEQLIREIEVQGACCREYQVKTVFIGGGTPSVMEPCLIRDIMQALNRNFDIAGDAEITIEVNPGTLLQNKLHIYRAAGINRLSIGLQSADNQELKDLGRIHTFEEFLKSYQCARMAGFTNVNVDLMSSIPGQTLESWKNTLKKVTMLKPEHISAYSLIVEEGTPFWDRYGKREGEETGLKQMMSVFCTRGAAAKQSRLLFPEKERPFIPPFRTRTQRTASIILPGPFWLSRGMAVTRYPITPSPAGSACTTPVTGGKYLIWAWVWEHPPA